jgi:hypothetical protein
MPERLNSMWEDINTRYFAGELEPLSCIFWDKLTADEGIGAHGFYEWRGRGIVIDDEFKFDDALVAAGDEKENAKMEAAYRLVLHEMIHQALHERGDPRFGKHEKPFLDEAIRIAEIMGMPPPALADVRQWPWIAPLILQIRAKGE